jgi:hypothetical protein
MSYLGEVYGGKVMQHQRGRLWAIRKARQGNGAARGYIQAVLYILILLSLVLGRIKVTLSIRNAPPLNVRKDPTFSRSRVRRTTRPMTCNTRTSVIYTTT